MSRKILAGLFFAAAFAGPALALPPEGFVVVNADGSVARGTNVKIGHLGDGQYQADMQAKLLKCAFTATPGSSDATVPPAGFAVVARVKGSPDVVSVTTYNAEGTRADLGFQLIVRC